MNFPFVTTFMAAEMLGIKKKGFPIVVMPINLHSFDNVQEIYHNLKDDLHYPPFFSLKVIYAIMYFLLKKPKQLIYTLFEIVISIRKPAKYVLQTYAILPKAIYCAWYASNHQIGHVHGNWAHYPTTIAYIIYRLTGIPFSFSSHAGADIYRNTDFLDKKIEASVFSVTCVKENKTFMENLVSMKLDNKVYVQYHGINLKKFKQRTKNILLSYKGPYMLLSVGNLHEAKGFQYMIEACKLLKDKKIQFKYYIVGQGYFYNNLMVLIDKLELNEHVELTGQILHKDLLSFYNKSHVFIMPSVVLDNGGRDGIPNVVIEAMSVGIPVIGSNAAGIPEVVFHENTGLLVNQRNPSELSSATERILNDIELRKKVVENATFYVSKYFNRDESHNRLFEIFRKNIQL